MSLLTSHRKPSPSPRAPKPSSLPAPLQNALLATFQLYLPHYVASETPTHHSIALSHVADLLQSHGFILEQLHMNALYDQYHASGVISFAELLAFINEHDLKRVQIGADDLQSSNANDYKSLTELRRILTLGQSGLSEEQLRDFMTLVQEECPSDAPVNSTSLANRLYLKTVHVTQHVNLLQWRKMRKMLSAGLCEMALRRKQCFGVFVLIGVREVLHSNILWESITHLMVQFNGEIVNIDARGRLQIVFYEKPGEDEFVEREYDSLDEDNDTESVYSMISFSTHDGSRPHQVTVAQRALQFAWSVCNLLRHSGVQSAGVLSLAAGSFSCFAVPSQSSEKFHTKLLVVSTATNHAHRTMEAVVVAKRTGASPTEHSVSCVLHQSAHHLLSTYCTVLPPFTAASEQFFVVNTVQEPSIHPTGGTIAQELDAKHETNCHSDIDSTDGHLLRFIPHYIQQQHLYSTPSLTSPLLDAVIMLVQLSSPLFSTSNKTIIKRLNQCLLQIESIVSTISGILFSVHYSDSSILLTVCFAQEMHSDNIVTNSFRSITSAFDIIACADRFSFTSGVALARDECFIGLHGAESKNSTLAVYGKAANIAHHLLLRLNQFPNLKYRIVCDEKIRKSLSSSEMKFSLLPEVQVYDLGEKTPHKITPFTILSPQSTQLKPLLSVSLVSEDNLQMTEAQRSAFDKLQALAMEYLSQSHQGELVLLSGGVASGKQLVLSKLGAYLRSITTTSRIQAIPTVIVSTIADYHANTVPFSLWQPVFQHMMNGLDMSDPSCMVDREEALQQWLLPQDMDHASLLNTIFGTNFPETGASQYATGKWRVQKMLQILVRCIQQWSAQSVGRIVVLFHNVHRADDLSLEVLEACSEVHNLLIVGSVAQSERRALWTPRPRSVYRLIELDYALTRHELTQIIITRASVLMHKSTIQSVCDELISLVQDYSGDSILFAQEFVRYLVATEALECVAVEGGSPLYHVERLCLVSQRPADANRDIPATLRDLFSILIGYLDERDLLVLSHAAVCGMQFSVDELRSVFPDVASKRMIDYVLEQLSLKNGATMPVGSTRDNLRNVPALLKTISVPADSELESGSITYAFRFPFIRDTLLERQSEQLRATCHIRLSDYHLSQLSEIGVAHDEIAQWSPVHHRYSAAKHRCQALLLNRDLLLNTADALDTIQDLHKAAEAFSSNCLFQMAISTLREALDLFAALSKHSIKSKSLEQECTELHVSTLYALATILPFSFTPQISTQQHVQESVQHLVHAWHMVHKEHPLFFDLLWKLWWHQHNFAFIPEVKRLYAAEPQLDCHSLVKSLLHYAQHLTSTEQIEEQAIMRVYSLYAAALTHYDKFLLTDALQYKQLCISLYQQAPDIASDAAIDYGYVEPKIRLLVVAANIYQLQGFQMQALNCIGLASAHRQHVFGVHSLAWYYLHLSLFWSGDQEFSAQLLECAHEAESFFQKNNVYGTFDELILVSRFLQKYAEFFVNAHNKTKEHLDSLERIVVEEFKGAAPHNVQVLLLRCFHAFIVSPNAKERKNITLKALGMAEALLASDNLHAEWCAEALLIKGNLLILLDQGEKKVNSVTSGGKTPRSNERLLRAFARRVEVINETLFRALHVARLCSLTTHHVSAVLALSTFWRKKHIRVEQTQQLIEIVLTLVVSKEGLEFSPRMEKNIAKLNTLLQQSENGLTTPPEEVLVSDKHITQLHFKFSPNMRLQKYVKKLLKASKSTEQNALKVGDSVPFMGVLQTAGEVLDWGDLMRSNLSMIIVFVPSICDPWSETHLARLNALHSELRALRSQVIVVSPDENLLDSAGQLSYPLVHDSSLTLGNMFHVVLPSPALDHYKQCLTLLSHKKVVRPLDHCTLNATYIVDTSSAKIVTSYVDSDFRNQLKSADIMDSVRVLFDESFRRGGMC